MPKPNQMLWKRISIEDLEVVKDYEKTTLYRLTAGGDYAGWCIMLPKSRVFADKVFSYKEFDFTLRDKDGNEKVLTDVEFADEIAKIGKYPKYDNGREYLHNCPPTLRSEKKFVIQKLVWNEEKGKFTKIPINAKTGGQAQSNNPETWASFEEATAGLEKYNIRGGIGYVLTGSDGIVGIDLDLDATTGKLTPQGEEILEKLKGKTYIEYSASGAIHIFGYGVKPGVCSRGVEDSHLEMYGGTAEGNRTLMLTGKIYGEKPVAISNIQKEINAVYDKYFKRPEIVTTAVKTNTTLTERGVIDKIRASKIGSRFDSLMAGDVSAYGGDYSKADLSLCSMIAFYTQDENVIDNIYRQSGLYTATKHNELTGKMESRATKWDTVHGSRTYGQQTIDLAIRSRTKVYEEKKEPKMLEIEPLRVLKQTEKAVLVKYSREDTPHIKEDVWLSKTCITIDKYNKVVSVKDFVVKEKKIPLKKAPVKKL